LVAITSSPPSADVAIGVTRLHLQHAQRLRHLRLHPVRRIEVFSGIGDKLRVAWMIDGFHADDDVHQLGIVVVNVLDQFGLCIGWLNLKYL
jgi:hypothetical protein